MKRLLSVAVFLVVIAAPVVAAPTDRGDPRQGRDREWQTRLPKKIVHVINLIVQPLSDILLPPRP